MSTGRRSARREAVFILYQQDLLSLGAAAALQRSRPGGVDEYARRLVLGVQERRQEIDALIDRHIVGWHLDRLGILERAILRVAAYELRWMSEVPNAVVINEAVTLAKRFCSAEAGALVNGVLGAMAAAEEKSEGPRAVEEAGEHA
jgi:transcription antitermination protein NusB